MKQFFCFLYVTFLLSSNVYAQVTVGSSEPPAPGAILQLKDIKGVTGGEANAYKGLLLPRVYITDLKKLKMSETVAEITDETTKGLHTGLVAFNTYQDMCQKPNPIRKGVYTWTGSEWTYLPKNYDNSVEFYEDQDGNTFRARRFGSAGIWMIDNLRVTRLASNLGGTSLNNEGETASSTTKFAFAYPNKSKATFDADPSMGLLYDWSAATVNKPLVVDESKVVNKVEVRDRMQGICPEGWHLPTIGEWIELEKEIIANSKDYSSQASLSEPAEGLDPMDPYNGVSLYSRGTHGRAMQSPCNVPGITTTNSATGKTVYDGGFAISMAGLLAGSINSYGRIVYFHSGDLERAESGAVGYVANYYSSSSSAVAVVSRSIGASDNGGYLSVRCKKD